jgi:hypothetical protein
MKKSITNSPKVEKNSYTFILYSLSIKVTNIIIMIRIADDATHSIV